MDDLILSDLKWLIDFLPPFREFTETLEKEAPPTLPLGKMQYSKLLKDLTLEDTDTIEVKTLSLKRSCSSK